MDPHDDRVMRAPPRGPSPWLTLLLLAAVAFLAWKVLAPHRSGPLHVDAESRPVTPRGSLADYEKSTIEIFRKASPSVVNVANVAIRRNPWSLNLTEIPQGTGSGFVWDARGYVVTNNHVVENGSAFFVTLADRSTHRALLVGASPEHDLAVLKIEDPPADGLPPLAIGSADDLQVGQSVFAIGNPFGLDHSLTTGIVSGLDREIKSENGRPLGGLIQTDAAINPGNSGGPLLDSAGRLIGVNTAIVSRSGAWAGIGFAVPIETVNEVVPELIRGEKPAIAGMGIRLLQERFLPRGIEGVGVLQVVPNGAAAAAGMQPVTQDAWSGQLTLGDVIVAIDGKTVKTPADYHRIMAGKKVGQQVRVTVLRGNARRDLEVTLQAIE